MAYYHAMLDEEEEARSSARLAATDKQNAEVFYVLAQTFCKLRDTNQSLYWLGKALAAGFSQTLVRDNPLFDHLKNNPEFQRLLKAN